MTMSLQPINLISLCCQLYVSHRVMLSGTPWLYYLYKSDLMCVGKLQVMCSAERRRLFDSFNPN